MSPADTAISGRSDPRLMLMALRCAAGSLLRGVGFRYPRRCPRKQHQRTCADPVGTGLHRAGPMAAAICVPTCRKPMASITHCTDCPLIAGMIAQIGHPTNEE